MSSYVSAELRRLVSDRADHLCEYCLIHENDTFFGCQVDHVVSEKHGGKTLPENLAYACAFCNRRKGTDLGSISPRGGELIPFFNPRRDSWHEHFRLEGSTIVPLTDKGEVTAAIFGFNLVDRLLERNALVEVGRYPCPEAQFRSRGGAV